MENEESGQTSALVVAPNVQGAVAAMQQFQLLKAKLLDANDTVNISGKPYIKRSGWRKIALAFNVSTEILRTYPIKMEAAIIGYTVEARAVAANGRSAIDQASCEFSELKNAEKTHHNVITRATTRALNRCVSDLCGGGEVSAEEMEIEQTQTKQVPQKGITEKQTAYFNKLAERLQGANIVDVVPLLKDMPLEKFTLEEAKAAIDALKKFVEGIERKV